MKKLITNKKILIVLMMFVISILFLLSNRSYADTKTKTMYVTKTTYAYEISDSSTTLTRVESKKFSVGTAVEVITNLYQDTYYPMTRRKCRIFYN